MLFGGNAEKSAAGGVSSGATIGAGNAGQSVDPNPFCNTGVITPLCNGGTKIFEHSNAVGDVCVKYDNDTNIITVSCNTIMYIVQYLLSHTVQALSVNVLLVPTFPPTSRGKRVSNIVSSTGHRCSQLRSLRI